MFPAEPLTVTIRAAFGADRTADPSTWVFTDITAYWHASDPIGVSDGRSDGATQAEASELTVTFRDDTGDLMPDDPRSRWYPHVADGLPIEVEVNAGLGDHTLFQGFVSTLQPEWPGRSRHMCLIQVTAHGIIAMLGRGAKPLKAPIRRAVLADSPVAYWPLDDGRDSTGMASGLQGGSPLVIAGEPVLADVDGPAGGPGRYVTVRSDDTALGWLTATGVAMDDTGRWVVEAWIRSDYVEDDPSPRVQVMTWQTTGDYSEWSLDVWSSLYATATPGEIYIIAWHRYSATSKSGVGVSVPDSGGWHYVRVESYVSAGQMHVYVTVDASTDGAAIRAATTSGAVTALTIGDPGNDIVTQGVTSVAVAHVSVYGTDSPSHYQAGVGFAAEAASDRIARLCAEEGVRATVEAGATVAMGVQAEATLLDLLRACETADKGRLSEGDWGLWYRPRVTLYNQTATLVVDAARRELSAQFAPVRDLQRVRNEWEVSRPGGGRAIYIDTAHQETHGRLDDSQSVSVATDDALRHHAEWLTGIGTTPGMRYPSLSLDLARVPHLIDLWRALSLGDRVRVTNLLPQHPPDPVDQLIEGRRQTIKGRRDWRVTMVVSPARPYDVFIIGDTSLGRLEATSALSAAAGSGDPTISVATTALPLWTTTATFPGDFPLDIDVNGERMTVTAITGTSSPQTFTVTRAVNGIRRDHTAGSPVRLWRPGVLAL